MKLLSACLLMLVLGMAHHASAVVYVVEVFYLIEPQVIRNYMALGYNAAEAKTQVRQDIKYYIYQANEYYKSLASLGLDLQLRISGIEFADEEIFGSDDVSHYEYVDATVAMSRLEKWVNTKDAQNQYKYDIGVLLTGFNLVSEGRERVAGYATVEGACTKYNRAIVEFKHVDTSITLAHEIGHSLGALHDGSGNKCDKNKGYIMSPKSGVKNENRWSFSSCTKNYIKAYIKELDEKGTNCFLKTTVLASTDTLGEFVGTNILDKDKVCQVERGDPKAFFSRSKSVYGGEVIGDAICKVLMCGVPDSSSFWHDMPTDGMVCNIGMRCYQGKCLKAPADAPTPSNLNKDCMWGDSRSRHLFSNFDGGCQEYISQKGSQACYDDYLRYKCCETCDSVKTNVPNCEYGDRSSLCVDHAPENICFGQQLVTCCHRCKDYL